MEGKEVNSAKAAIIIAVVKPIPPTPTPTIGASTYAVSMTAGDTAQTVTITGTASRNGTLTYEKVSGPDWATLSGNTLTLAPDDDVKEDDYRVVVRVIETTGAGTEDEISGSTKSDPIVVTVARSAQSTEPEKSEEQKEAEQAQTNNITGTETEEEDTSTEEHEEEILVETKSEGTVLTLPEEATANTEELAESAGKGTSDAMKDAGFSDEDAATTEENTNETLNDEKNQSEFLDRLGIGGGDASSTGRADKNELEVGSASGNELEEANKKLAGDGETSGNGNTRTAAGAWSNMSHPKGGLMDFFYQAANALFNTRPIINQV